MRLIDADAVIKAVDKHTKDCSEIVLDNDISCILEEVPTAYNVEKVISDLEREKMIICGCHMIETNVIKIDDAIEIVRKGGV